MSYQVLARKWRPRTFQEMAGQEHVLRALINALDHQRLHHAYLFTGTRGVGKTTIGRILAKCLNCEVGISATPCGQCTSCQEIDQGRFVDLIEVDAASRTKVEDTRELLDNVQYAPTRGRFKVYLIDEAHMLSSHSFNALLKTLEEPPPHVKFLLATTDPQKLPITILSRCLQFNLKNMLPERIDEHLQYILQQEAIPFEASALPLLARAADGSMRDALSLLDQAIAFGAGNVKTADVSAMLGTIEQRHIIAIIEALANHDGKALIHVVAHLAEHGSDFAHALEDLLTFLHRIALFQVIPDVDDAQSDQAVVQQFAQQFSKEEIQLYYQIGLIGRRDLPLAPNPKLGLEMVLLRMLAFHPGQPTVSTKTIEKVVARPPIAKQENLTAIQSPPTPKNTAPTDSWSALLSQLNLTGLTLALANHCTLKEQSNEHIELILDANQAALLNAKQEERLSQALAKHLGKVIKLTVSVATSGSSPASNSPAATQKQQQDQRQQAAIQAIEKDEHVQTLIKKFGAKVQTVDVE